MSEKLITSSELAERLALLTSTVLDWFEAGGLPGFKLGAPCDFRESGRGWTTGLTTWRR